MAKSLKIRTTASEAMSIAVTASVIIFFTAAAWLQAGTSQSLTLQLHGYAKNLAIYSSSILTKDTFYLNLTRLRFKNTFDAASFVHSEVWLDSELLYGSFLKTADANLAERITRPTFFDFDWTLGKGQRHRIEQSLFRAFATIYAGKAEITLGRQRIAWGTGFAWNPTDLLNPYNPVAIELAEKRGVDAAHLSVPLGALSKVEAAYAPGKRSLRGSAATRMSTNVGNYDIAILAGKFQGDKVLGGDFAGYIGGAGLRGEAAYTWSGTTDSFLRATLNADYNFAHDMYAFVEFYYNGSGASNKSSYDLRDLLSGRIFNLAKHYLALSVNKIVTPLLISSIYGLINLDDGSSLIGPSLTYSVATNLEIAVSAYLTRGADSSEYGRLASSYFGYLQYYF